MMNSWLRCTCLLAAVVIISATTTRADETPPGPIQVFILAGQSNMEGQGVVDLDHPDHYNSGRGTLLHVMRETEDPERYAHVSGDTGEWVVRDDVWVRFKTRHEIKTGGLTIGFAGYPGRHHIGPEFQFGHVVGDAVSEPVLLIKTAWGGKSLHVDFRPPSSGGETGEFYVQMLEEINEALDSIASDFPTLADRDYELAGFVWFQGWNDMYDDAAREEYEQNLVNLIHDVRTEFDVPALPVVVGELGNGGTDAGDNMLAIRQAQAATADRAEFDGTVTFVKTTDFARPADDSPNRSHGHHWFGNAESYFLIGDALGEGMLELLGNR